MTDQINPKKILPSILPSNLPPLSAGIIEIEIERNKEELKRIRECLDFAMQTVNELVAMFEPKITKNLDGKDTDENPLSLDTKETQQLKINSLVVELDKLTQQEIFLLINSDFPNLQLEINQLCEEIKQEIKTLGLDLEVKDFSSLLEKGQKKINTREKIIYANSFVSIINLAVVLMSITAIPVLSISAASLNLLVMLSGENGKRKLDNILKVG